MNGSKSKINALLVKIGLIAAISVIMSIPPFGTIKIPVFLVDVTLAHLPAIIMSILEGPIVGAICGLILGVISLVRCVTEPVGLNILIANPLISVLPRILVGAAAGLCYHGFRRILKTKVADTAAIGISAAVSSVVNTVGVLGMLYVIYLNDIIKMLAEYGMDQAAGAFLLGIATTGGLGEMIIIGILTPAIVLALRRAGYKKTGIGGL